MAEILSPNMLKTFEQCPKRFFFRYVKSISMPVNDEIFVTGKNIHALASYYLKKENIDKMELSLNEKEKELWKYLKSCKYFSYDVVDTEYSLSVKIGKRFFGGRLDALVTNKNKYYILDYKTGSAPKDSENDFQTMIYLMSVRARFKTENITFVYLDLKNKKETVIELTSELVRKYEQRLTEIAEKIEKSDYKVSNKGCSSCEYGIICYDKKLPD